MEGRIDPSEVPLLQGPHHSAVRIDLTCLLLLDQFLHPPRQMRDTGPHCNDPYRYKQEREANRAPVTGLTTFHSGLPVTSNERPSNWAVST